MDRVHYVMGIGFYTSKMTTIFLFKSAWFIFKNIFFLTRWTLTGTFRGIAHLYRRVFYQDDHINIDESSDTNSEMIDR